MLGMMGVVRVVTLTGRSPHFVRDDKPFGERKMLR